MKKILGMIAAGALCYAAGAQTMTLTNTFGGDYDDVATSDMITFSRFDDKGTDEDLKNPADDDVFSPSAIAGDRLQFDFVSAKFDGRLRLRLQTPALGSGGWNTGGGNGKGDAPLIYFQGYARFIPVEYVAFGFGNQYFLKTTLGGAYLPAAADVPAWGRMIRSGLSVTGKIPVGLTLTGSFSPTGKLDNMDNLGFDFGIDWLIANAVSIGATFQNVTSEKAFTSGVFAGLKAVDNLTLNAGFVWNAAENDFFYKSSKTALQFSAGYTFVDAGFGLYLDLISGLSNEYINSDGDTEEYTDDGVPFQAMVRATVNVTEAISLSLESIVKSMLGAEDTVVQAYPYIKYKLPHNFGTFKAGVRLNFQDQPGTEMDGLKSFSFPISWEYKIISKK
ncbi:MAG: hypothetical protein K2H09_08515 [Treponemataceae bacterium]|nr:hypothetical protein [Treponemataceae bacterium]